MKTETLNSRLLHIFIFVGILFACLALYLTWFELHGKTSIMQSTYNRRLQTEEAKVLRGQIVDRNGVCLARTDVAGGAGARIYPFKNLYAHVIGYDSLSYGKSLLEARYNSQLLGHDGLEIVNKLGSMLSGNRRTGYNLTLSIDNELQQKARDLMGKRRGAVVALNPKTGEILAMVSTPDYDPNGDALQTQWANLVEDENSPLLPRAVMGLYPPGSTFKVVTSAAGIENGLGSTTIEDTGKTVVDGKTLENFNGHAYGTLDMKQAFTVSSNVYFAELAGTIGANDLLAKAKAAGIGQKLAFDVPVSESRIGDAGMGQTELASTGIGQGRLQVTPLQMAMISAGIANDGNIEKPSLVKSISDVNGNVLRRTQPQLLYHFTDTETSLTIREMMRNVVEHGTGTRAAIRGISVAGKTGTAQNEKSSQGEGYDHSWFIGFAPADDPQIAIAVVLEYSGQEGGKTAASIAGKVMDTWIRSSEK